VTSAATVEQAEGMNATGIPVPAAVVAALGAGRRPVETAKAQATRERRIAVMVAELGAS
jgi:hypothetical protein